MFESSNNEMKQENKIIGIYIEKGNEIKLPFAHNFITYLENSRDY